MSAVAVPLARRVTITWERAALAGVLAVAAFLNLWNLGQNGWANAYYSGAVRSMTQSWHNFFFASFDPGGLVSVDKPPLALWLEAASAKLFGFSGWAILLPEALAGIAAVWLLYLLVARVFGRPAGLVAALALAVSPVSVSVNRDNNPDALLALLLVAAAYVGLRAVESGRLRTLLLSAVLIGLAFNTKMLAAAVVVPGLALAYAAFARVPWKRRLVFLALAGVVLVLVSGAWIAAVDLTPASQRPYVGSTGDNSALSLAFDYNGLGRVTGQEGGTSVGGGGGLGGAFSGSPGVLRLLNQQLGEQGAWLLPFAIVGGLSALGLSLVRRRRRELAAIAIVGGWFAAAAFVFSYSSGIIHTYYLSALAPALCGLVGIGTVALWRDARAGLPRLALPVLAIALSAGLELELMRRSSYQSWLQGLLIAGCLLACIVIAIPRRWATQLALAVGLFALLAAPAAWSASTLTAPVNGVFPGAGPSFVGGSGGFARFGGGPPGFGNASSTSIDTALAYAKAHDPGSRWALVVTSEQAAAPYVIKGESVAAMGGFTGRETVLTPAYLSSLVRSGAARYFLLDSTGGMGFRGDNSAVSLVESACTSVSSVQGLYDCAGKAAAIAAS